VILDLLEIWLSVTGAFVVGAFAGALLHDWLAGSRLGAGQAAFAEVVAMGVNGSQRAIAARRARRIERLTRARGHAPPAEDAQAAPVPGQLDRIERLEPAMAVRLAAAGYGRLDQLRRWSDDEQVWIADMLGVHRRDVRRWVARAQAIVRSEQAALETPPPKEKEKPPRRERLVERRPVGERRPEKVVAKAPPLLRSPVAKPVAAEPTEPLTPYEIALDLKLREP
jgi:predicted flap endonuclease-1-like 5' DNA nuclease